MLRIRQRSRRGTQTVCNVPKMCRKRFLVIPAIGHDGLVGSKVVEGTVNRKIFEKFLKPRVVSIYLSLIRMVTHLMVMWCSSRVWTGTQRLVAYWSWTMIPSTTEDTSLRCVSSKVAHSHLSPHLVKLSDTDWLVSGLVSQVFSSSTYHRTALSSTPSSWALGSWRWTFAGPKPSRFRIVIQSMSLSKLYTKLSRGHFWLKSMVDVATKCPVDLFLGHF